MKKFSVLIRGENLFINLDDSVKRMGFYATRLVEAGDQEEAELRAVESLRQDEKLRACVLNDPGDPPKLLAEEIEEIESFGEPGDQPSGFTFYEDKPTLN